MPPLRCSLNILLVLGIFQLCLAVPVIRVKRQRDDLLSLDAEGADAVNGDLNPINAEAVSGDELERNKRKLPDATFEAKNAILGFVFGLSQFKHLPNSRLIRPARATSGASNKYDDVPEFDRKQVSLDFPDELFNKSFATLTNISKSVSQLIMNSARRYSRFVLFFKPIFGDALVVKGWEDPTTTTTTPKPRTTTTTSNPLDTLNEV